MRLKSNDNTRLKRTSLCTKKNSARTSLDSASPRYRWNVLGPAGTLTLSVFRRNAARDKPFGLLGVGIYGKYTPSYRLCILIERYNPARLKDRREDDYRTWSRYKRIRGWRRETGGHLRRRFPFSLCRAGRLTGPPLIFSFSPLTDFFFLFSCSLKVAAERSLVREGEETEWRRPPRSNDASELVRLTSQF